MANKSIKYNINPNNFRKQGKKECVIPSIRIDAEHDMMLDKILKRFNKNTTDFFTGCIEDVYFGHIDTKNKIAGADTPAKKSINKSKNNSK